MSSHCRFYGGLPPAFVDLQELYIKVCEKDWVRQTLKGRRKKRDVEIERDAFESTTHAHTNTQ